jgi:hypothetical protein
MLDHAKKICILKMFGRTVLTNMVLDGIACVRVKTFKCDLYVVQLIFLIQYDTIFLLGPWTAEKNTHSLLV